MAFGHKLIVLESLFFSVKRFDLQTKLFCGRYLSTCPCTVLADSCVYTGTEWVAAGDSQKRHVSGLEEAEKAKDDKALPGARAEGPRPEGQSKQGAN